jgi:hypothetical protein
MYVLKRDMDATNNLLLSEKKKLADLNFKRYLEPTDALLKADSIISSDFKSSEKEYIKLKGNVLKYSNTLFKEIKENWNKILDGILPSTKKSSSQKDDNTKELGAVPGLSSILGQKEVNLNLSVLGFKKVESGSSSIYGEVKLFTSGIKTDSTQNLRTLFLPEASNFGITGKINIGLGLVNNDSTRNNKVFGINLEFNLLGKKIKPDNSNTENSITPLVFHTKTGLEFIAIKNFLSLYANVNTITTLDNVEKFKINLNTTKLFRGFVDFGARILLAPTDSKLESLGLKFKLDLGFISNGNNIKSIIKSDDLIIPTFRFGLQKDFNL